MHLTPESKSVLDLLLAGNTVKAESVDIGPLDQTGQLLLELLIENYDQLHGDHGAQQVEVLLNAYERCLSAKMEAKSPDSAPPQSDVREDQTSHQDSKDSVTSTQVATIPSFDSACRWRLHELKCRSIKGVAPRGEEFSFSFEGKSTLLFGPNGSGKSSLLGSIIWVLTGLTLTDTPDQQEVSSIYSRTDGTTRGSKIRNWPTICTLPETGDPATVNPDSMGLIQLTSFDGKSSVYLKRTIERELVHHNI